MTALASQLATPFGEILCRAVAEVPTCVGASFADVDGEVVDAVAVGDPLELAIMTAHYGVILRHLTAAFGTWHVGAPEFVLLEHGEVDVLLHRVAHGYYALLAARTPAPLGRALAALAAAAADLRRELA